jgi:hypothetical protein
MKIIILIIASTDAIHEKDLTTQKKTWIDNKHKNVRVLYLRGWEHNSFFLDQDTLFVPCEEKYNSILEKTILGIKYILENIDFDIIIRSNVSTYYETNKLVAELKKSRYKQDFFGGYFDQSKKGNLKDHKNREYISGTGIFLSKRVAEKLIEIDSKNYLGTFDDLAIFNYLKNTEFRKIRMQRNNMHSTNIFIPTYHIRMKNSFNYESASRRMILVNSFFQARSIKTKLFAYWRISLNEANEFRNSPESIRIFLRKNRVVFSSYSKLILSRIFRKK